MTDYVTPIIDKFGGVCAFARALECPAPTVCNWKRVNEIPPKRQRQIVRVAKQMRVKVRPADFFLD